MRQVISEFAVRGYMALQLNGPIPLKPHTKYRIQGKIYDIVPVYDMPNCIGIKATGSFLGAEVEFI